MVQLIPIALFGWIPLCVILFAKLPPRRALIYGVIGATLFMPMGEVQTPVVPWTKLNAISIGLVLASLLMDPGTLLSYRPRLVDLPMLLVCFVPGASAIANNMTPTDAIAASATSMAMYGLAYILGRVYLTDVHALREMAYGIFVGGLIYAPLCVIEMIISPQLHNMVYGFHPHPDFSQTVRFGGYRPMMFMQHGLMVGLFMSCAAVCGIWLWKQRAVTRVLGRWPMGPCVAVVALVALACKSTGATILALLSLAVLGLTRRWRRYWLIYTMLAIPLLYMGARTMGAWNGGNAVALAKDLIGTAQAGSLQVRLENEDLLVARAMERILLGWGHMGDNLIHDADGRIISIPDGLWVIQLGRGGIVLLAATFIAFMLPSLALLRRFPARVFGHPAFAAPGVLAVFAGAYAIDCLLNAMVNPIYLVAIGGVAALSVSTNPIPRPVTGARIAPGRARGGAQAVAPGGRASGNAGRANRPPRRVLPA